MVTLEQKSAVVGQVGLVGGVVLNLCWWVILEAAQEEDDHEVNPLQYNRKQNNFSYVHVTDILSKDFQVQE